jgi:hypothetical protein
MKGDYAIAETIPIYVNNIMMDTFFTKNEKLRLTIQG